MDCEEPELEIAGQLTFMVEEAVLVHVMKGIGDHKKQSIYTIQHLENAIEKKERFTDVFPKEDDRKSAEDRWNELKADIGWEGRHYRDLEMLKSRYPRPWPYLPSVQSEVTTEQLYGTVDKVCRDERLKCVYRQFLEMIEKIESIESE